MTLREVVEKTLRRELSVAEAAKIAGVAAVVLTGLGMAFSEGGSGMRKLVTVAFGLTIAFAATTFFLPLFGYAGGAAF